MKLFNFFKNKTPLGKDSLEGTSVGELRTRRNHPRFAITAGTDLCFVKHPSGELYAIADISFKGCFLKSEGRIALDQTPPAFMALHFFGQVLEAPIKEIQKRPSGWALVFDHAKDEFVFGMSTLIEPLRCGSTCVEVRKEQKDVAPTRKRYSGDGPFDLVTERDAKDELVFGMATIRRGMTYASTLLENGVIITKKCLDSRGVGARMSQTPEADPEIVMYSAMVCLGMKFKDGQDMAKCLGRWLTENSLKR